MTTTTTADSNKEEYVHLIILHHGLWGNVGHVRFIAEQFKQRLGDRLLVYRAQANESAFTYDGIDVCGQRLVQEIHSVIKVIEDGGNIEEMKGQKLDIAEKSNKKTKEQKNSTTTTEDLSENNLNTTTTESGSGSGKKQRRVAQFSFLGYSLGGLIGRFAMAMLDLEGFFTPRDQGGRGVEPVYFVTMVTPHLGIRQPSRSRSTQLFNFLSARMLSRTGEQLQLVDDYLDGKPILLVMSEPTSIFIHVLAKFKRRVVYSNVRNDRSVPFWTASFSDADPFRELGAMDIQYHDEYSSLIESYEHHDQEALERIAKERADFLKTASFTQRTSIRLKAIPWKKYFLFGLLGPVLIPVWIVIACSAISVQGFNSRRRTKQIVGTNPELDKMKEEAGVVRVTNLLDEDSESANESSAVAVVEGPKKHGLLSTRDTQADSSVTLQEDNDPEALAATTDVTDTTAIVTASPKSVQTSIAETIDTEDNQDSDQHKNKTTTNSGSPSPVVSYSFPHLKNVRQLRLLPVQIAISRNMNRLEWKKNAIHCATAMNAHASIVVRERRFSGKDGIAAVQHAVDMFRDDGEDV
ncbi:MAG: putative serine esterase-domain-containing protein [Linnemannia gamsii]|nr:MAG: putative serine esterase-domain-containing protein [Linnemannia gamsii]